MVYAANTKSAAKMSNKWDDGNLGSATATLTKTNKFVILITAVTAGNTAIEVDDKKSCDKSTCTA
jgi:hypothetical protein